MKMFVKLCLIVGWCAFVLLCACFGFVYVISDTPPLVEAPFAVVNIAILLISVVSVFIFFAAKNLMIEFDDYLESRKHSA